MPENSRKTTEIDRRAQSPNFICKLSSGLVFLSNMQFLRGYCILQAYPVVKSINVLKPEQRIVFYAIWHLWEMSSWRLPGLIG